MLTTGLDVAKMLEGLDFKQHINLVAAKLGDRIGARNVTVVHVTLFDVAFWQ